MGKKKQNSNIGRSLIKDRFGGGSRNRGESHLHTSELQDGYDWNRLNLKSVTEENTLDEFLATAELAGTEFTAEKLNVKIVSQDHNTGLLNADEEAHVQNVQSQHRKLLKVPRRPEWDEFTTASELDLRERQAFLDWRRQLAELQEVEGLILTPFEKNLDFWRQLWRVIERSDVVVQIVDARNPLLFRCEDLEQYVKEVDASKKNMVLVNKADYLTPKQRKHWAEYFDKIGVHVAFWSAVLQTEKNKLENEGLTAEQNEEESSDYNTDSDEEEEMEEDEDHCDECTDNRQKEDLPESSEQRSPAKSTEGAESASGLENDTQKLKNLDLHTEEDASSSQDNNIRDNSATCKEEDKNNIGSPGAAEDDMRSTVKNSPEILDGDALIELFRSIHPGKTYTEGVTTIGLVGYPNVGKSSTINAILQTKKVAVSATPGRTKHFQTVYIDPTLMLCDCPGLVMPSFVSTKAHMVVNGVLPIDQMRDYVPPASLVCHHMGRDVLEATYGILLPLPQEGEDVNRPPTAHELLGAHACMRGYMTHKGVPDFQRSARQVLKDYVNGKLLYCTSPPDVSEEIFCPVNMPTKTSSKEQGTEEGASASSSAKMAPGICTNEVDRAFFHQRESRVGSKGVQGVLQFSRKDGFTSHHSTGEASQNPTPQSSMSSLNAKPWKKHNNKHKKEKLRRMNRHLDV